MSRVFLISSNMAVDPYPVYPVGMAIIASTLMSHGHQVHQFDMLAGGYSEEDLRKALTDFAPDYVGISIRNIDTVDSCNAANEWYLSTDLEIMKIIRQATKVPVILGGSAFSIMPEEILHCLNADYGIAGEGEHAVCSLITALNEGRSVPEISQNGAAFHSGDRITCPPVWERGLIDYYMKRSGMVSMQTKRGCPHKCSYCSYPAIEGDTIRYRVADDIADEVKRLQKDYGVNRIYFTDSVFNDGDEEYLKIAEILIRKNIEIEWSAFFRPESISKNKMNLLKRSGLYAIEAGSDAASDETLVGINKQFTFDDVYEFNQLCVDARIPCANYIIFGGPGETEYTVRQGLKNLELLKNCIVFAFSGIRILPQTELCYQSIEEGILQKEYPLLKPVYYFSPALDHETMNRTLAEAFQERPDRVFPPSRGLEMAQKMNSHGYYGLLWDRLIRFY